MFRYCPGARSIVNPRIIITKCPYCGGEIEFLSMKQKSHVGIVEELLEEILLNHVYSGVMQLLIVLKILKN
jgi:hypothetical protein